MMFFVAPVSHAGNPAAPFEPGDNVQDPGDTGTAWGGCGPLDSNCYVTLTSDIALSSIIAATGTNTINNGTYAQEWQWNSLAGNTAFKVSSNSTAAASNAQKLFEAALSGANATATQTTYSGYFTNVHTGTASTNVALYASASGGTNNYAAIFENGSVGIGTATPSSNLDITTNALGTTQTTSSGLALVNTTAAAAGAQQISPAIRWSGSGWKTNATAASQTVDFRAYVLPVQEAAAPTGNWVLQSSINGNAYAQAFAIGSAGQVFVNSSSGSSGQVLTSSGAAGSAVWGSAVTAGSGLTFSGSNTVELGGQASNDITLDMNSSMLTIHNASNVHIDNNGNSEIQLGDIDDDNNGAYIKLTNDGSLDLDSRASPFRLGDINDASNGTKLVFDDVNSRIYFDGVTDFFLGIDNSAPAAKLHIGNATTTTSSVLIRLEDDSSVCDFTADAGAPSCGSDRTLKKDIESLDTADLLSRVTSLNPVSYHWKTESSEAALQHGFIAQEVAEQFPDLVRNGTWTDGTTRKFLNTGGLMPYVIGAVKEIDFKVQSIEQLLDGEDGFVANLRLWLADATNSIEEFIATRIKARQEICIGETCIDEAQLKTLIDQGGFPQPSGPDAEPEPQPDPEPESDPQQPSADGAPESDGGDEPGDAPEGEDADPLSGGEEDSGDETPADDVPADEPTTSDEEQSDEPPAEQPPASEQ